MKAKNKENQNYIAALKLALTIGSAALLVISIRAQVAGREPQVATQQIQIEQYREQLAQQQREIEAINSSVTGIGKPKFTNQRGESRE